MKFSDNLFVSILLLGFMTSLNSCKETNRKEIVSGKIWYDVDDNVINAHGGGFLKYQDSVYWYGQIMRGKTTQPPSIESWNGTRVDAVGISCYVSKDLLNWKYQGNVLPTIIDGSLHDLSTGNVLERPKVIYHEKTEKFVVWLHVDSEDYSKSSVGVAVSDKPTGPFKYLRSFQPNDAMSRDQTLFKDNDGKAYHFYASENNMSMHVSQLTEDYLAPNGLYNRIFINQQRETPVVFKNENLYYAITSGCTGWDSNPAEYAISKSPFGSWEVIGSPCVNDTANNTFDSQGTFVLEFDDNYIFMADRWNRTDLEKSTYVWLPMKIDDKSVEIEWKDRW